MNAATLAVSILVLAFLAESMTEYFLSPVWDMLARRMQNREYEFEEEFEARREALRRAVTMYSAAGVGVLLAWLFDLDLFAAFLSLQAQAHGVAVVLTGLVIGRGSNYVHDVYKRITERPAAPE
jgi:site-specific recombinase